MSGPFRLRAGRRVVEISSPDRVLFPDAGLTKRDLAAYYVAVAPWMLPHVRERFVSLQRFPQGIEGAGFYQKDVPEHFPDWIRREVVGKEGGTLCQVVIGDAASLAYLANLGTITLHAWTSRVDRPREPDRVVFDLDPSLPDWRAAFADVIRTARDLRATLEQLGLAPYPMASGSRGLHLVAPLRRGADVDEVRAFAADVAALLARRDPDRLTIEHRKAKRGDRIFLDVARNGYAQTAVAPYSVRARPGAPVAAPLEWSELDEPDAGPRRFTIRNVLERLERQGDPWAGMGRHARGLGPARRELDALR
jgi:bifunctional non-homologous end joining protein LigD